MDKKQYDGYRQGVYNSAAAIVDRHDAYRNQNQLDAQALQYFIFDLDNIMADFQKQTDASRKPNGPIDAGWLDPRFHDYYDFFKNISAGWQRDLNAMAVTPTTPTVPVQPTTLPPVSPTTVPTAPTGGDGVAISVPTVPPVPVPGGTTNINVSTTPGGTPTMPRPPLVIPIPGGSSGGGVINVSAGGSGSGGLLPAAAGGGPAEAGIMDGLGGNMGLLLLVGVAIFAFSGSGRRS